MNRNSQSSIARRARRVFCIGVSAAMGVLVASSSVALAEPASNGKGREPAAAPAAPLPPKGAGPEVTGPEPAPDPKDVHVTDLTSARPDPKVVSELNDKLRRPDDRVDVIVQMRTRWVPETALEEPARQAQSRQLGLLKAGAVTSAPGARVLHHLDGLPSMALTVNALQLAALQAAPQVATIHPSRTGTVSDSGSAQVTQYDRAQLVGFDGQGFTVAILDTGIDRNHEYFGRRVTAEACFAHHTQAGSTVGDCAGGQTTATGTGTAAPCAGSGCDHGTHVAGIAAGSDPAGGTAVGNGVAPRASIMGVQVFHDVNKDCNNDGKTEVGELCPEWDEADVLAALNWVYQQRNNHKIAAVNLSIQWWLTSTACDSDALKAPIDQLKAAGIATVIAAGNMGKRDQVTFPACVTTAVTVGGTDNRDGIYVDSNASSTLMDLWAPGVGVGSSVLGGGYSWWSGTSMAAPHVAGAFAVLRQARECQTVVLPSTSVENMLRALTDTGLPVTDNRPADTAKGLPAGSVTKPRINVYSAARRWDSVGNSAYIAASALSGLAGTMTGGNRCATKETLGTLPEPNHGGDRGGASIWYKWTAPVSGKVRFTTSGSDFDTLLAVYEESPFVYMGNLVAQDDDGFGRQSVVEFTATGGKFYRIAVDGYRGTNARPAWGAVKLNWAQNRPANDDFAAATPFSSSYFGAATGSSARSMNEYREPAPAAPTVWFRWVAPVSSTVTFGTAESAFDTVLDVYRGTSLGGLVLERTDDDNGPGNTSLVSFPATGGQTYYARLRGYNGATGSYRLSYRLNPPLVRMADVTVKETAGVANVVVRLDGPSPNPVTMSFQTQSGTAGSWTDYQAKSGQITIEPGALWASIPVTVHNDGLAEPNETFEVVGSNLVGANNGDTRATVTIVSS